MPERDRDQSIEEILQRVMSNDTPPIQGACLDGETIAAWSEGTLHGAEASAVEHHVAGCARCRALMASFARTTPPEPVAPSLWQRWHLGWVVPLATAATAVAIWVALPENGNSPFAPTQEINTVARVEPNAPPPASPATESEQAAAALQAAARDARPQEETPKLAESVRSEVRQRADAQAPASTARGNEVSTGAGVPPPAATPAPPAAAPPASLSAAAPARAAAPAAQAGAGERAEADRKKEAADDSALAPLGAARQAFAPVQIVSPGSSVRWRIVNGRQVERSTDAGASWTPAMIDSSDGLIAGAAPFPAICWFVGARGAVYLTTDGTRFTRLPFTEIVDLTSVFATDALTATVSSADGRSWRTTDQGKTWSVLR